MISILRRAGFWLLIPFSALQGLWLRATAVRLPEASGDSNGVTGCGESLYLLAMGDSIIAGVGTSKVEHSLPVQFAASLAELRNCCVHWCVEGKNGASIADLREQVSALDDSQAADIVLISIGVNDVTGLSSTRRWRAQLCALTSQLRYRWPDAQVIFLGLPPMSKFPLLPAPLRFTMGLRARTLDDITAVIARQPGMQHIPSDMDVREHGFCEDGFHPSAKSCSLWARELTRKLEATAPSSLRTS